MGSTYESQRKARQRQLRTWPAHMNRNEKQTAKGGCIVCVYEAVSVSCSHVLSSASALAGPRTRACLCARCLWRKASSIDPPHRSRGRRRDASDGQASADHPRVGKPSRSIDFGDAGSSASLASGAFGFPGAWPSTRLRPGRWRCRHACVHPRWTNESFYDSEP